MKGIRFPFLIPFRDIDPTRAQHASARLIERPQAEAGPTRLSVGIWMVDITNIDSAQQNFTGEVTVVLRWRDPLSRPRWVDVIDRALMRLLRRTPYRPLQHKLRPRSACLALTRSVAGERFAQEI